MFSRKLFIARNYKCKNGLVKCLESSFGMEVKLWLLSWKFLISLVYFKGETVNFKPENAYTETVQNQAFKCKLKPLFIGSETYLKEFKGLWCPT